MATWKKERLAPGRPARSVNDAAREAATQTFISGAPLVIASTASEAASDPATVDGFSRQDGRNLASADAAGDPKLLYVKNVVGLRVKGSLKEALSTVNPGATTVGLLKEGSDWVWSTTAVNKKFKITHLDPRAAQADTYAIVEVETVTL